MEFTLKLPQANINGDYFVVEKMLFMNKLFIEFDF